MLKNIKKLSLIHFKGISKHEILHPEYEKKGIETNPDSEFQCDLCPFKSRFQTSLSKHKKNHELTSGNYKCRYCNFFSSYEYNMTNHEMLHPEYQPQDKPIVTKASPRLSLLKPNETIRNTNSRFSCQLCPYKTVDMRTVKVHLERHTPFPGALKCKYCNYYVSQRFGYLLEKHEKLHLPIQDEIDKSDFNRNYQCEICPYKAKDRKSLISHIQKHNYREGAEKCRYCSFYNLKKFNLLNHEKLHPEFTPRNDLENNFENQNQDSPDQIENNEIEIGDEEQKTNENEKLYGCNMCPYVSESSEKVKIHTQRHDPTKFSDKALKCKICSYRSMSPNVLRKHQKLHFNVKPVVVIKQESFLLNESSVLVLSKQPIIQAKNTYSCKICSYVSHQLDDFNLHLKQHENSFNSEKAVKCRYCNFYARESQIDLHEKNHPEYMSKETANDNQNETNSNKNQGESNDSLKCPHCHYKASGHEYLERHLQRHVYRENTIKCKHCNYFSSNVKNMKRHEDKHESLNHNSSGSNKASNSQSETESESRKQKRPKLSSNKDFEIDVVFDIENGENVEIIKECLNEIIESVEKTFIGEN